MPEKLFPSPRHQQFYKHIYFLLLGYLHRLISLFLQKLLICLIFFLRHFDGQLLRRSLEGIFANGTAL